MRKSLKSALLEELSEELHSLCPNEVIERLRSEQIISDTALERAYIRRRVEALARRGVGRTVAMEQTAVDVGCSYAKVKSIVYARC